jgi:hypothetical protein
MDSWRPFGTGSQANYRGRKERETSRMDASQAGCEESFSCYIPVEFWRYFGFHMFFHALTSALAYLTALTQTTTTRTTATTPTTIFPTSTAASRSVSSIGYTPAKVFQPRAAGLLSELEPTGPAKSYAFSFNLPSNSAAFRKACSSPQQWKCSLIGGGHDHGAIATSTIFHTRNQWFCSPLWIPQISQVYG